jgi:hypothetical protein
MHFLEGIKELGLDDLREIEVTYLLKVLSKSELDGCILLDELLQIMENFGLYDREGEDDEDAEADVEADADADDATATENSPQDNHTDSSPGQQESSQKKPSKKKKKSNDVDLSRLDNESIEIMAMLMLYCIRKGMSAHDVFEDVVYDQNIKSKSGNT